MFQLLDTLAHFKVKTGMMSFIKNIKIIRAVIKSITVDMVHFLPSFKFTTKNLLHYISVFINFPALTTKQFIILPVTMLINRDTAFVSGIILARITTRLSSPLSIAFLTASLSIAKPGRGDLERRLAY